MKQVLGIIFYKDNESFSLKKSKTTEKIFKIINIFLLIFLLMAIGIFFQNVVALRNYKWLSEISSYYIFEPSHETNQSFARKYQNYNIGEFSYGKAYSEYLGELQKKYSFDILSYNQITVYEDDKTIVLSYAKNNSYKSDYSIPKEIFTEGRSYSGNKNEVVLIKGNLYNVGDIVFFTNSEGKQERFEIVGKTKDSSYMQNIASDTLGVENIVAKYNMKKNKTIFVMNPLCDFNNEEHFMPSACSVLVRSDNTFLLKEIRDKGKISMIKYHSNKKQNEFIVSVFALIFSFIFYFFSTYILYMNEWKKNFFLWLLVGFFVGFLISSIIYTTSSYKLTRATSSVIMSLVPHIFLFIFQRNILRKDFRKEIVEKDEK